MAVDLLGRICRPNPRPFALLYRPDSTGPGTIEVFLGEMSTPATLDDIPLQVAPLHSTTSPRLVLAMLPYRQISERGFTCVDDASPLLAMTVTHQDLVPFGVALQLLPDVQTDVLGGHFDPGDDAYANLVRKIITDEIGQGQGANFVLKRSFLGEIASYTSRSALAVFRRLLLQETGAYWTYIVHTGAHTFVGASPERHVTLSAGKVVMNPISGTYRYPSSGPALEEVLAFLADPKERDELYMVVDEELKMMAKISDHGGRVVGPYLKEMAHLAHTEYFIEGQSSHDPRNILRNTMFAPTVTGSPLESACRVIARYEPGGRGYYSGVVALMGWDAQDRQSLDSAIIIRTADIDSHGHLDIGVGATLVRKSDPHSEVAETQAKVGGLLAAFGTGPRLKLGCHPRVRRALARRNDALAGFWLSGREPPVAETPFTRQRILVVDAEDNFTSMLALQLRSIGPSVTVCPLDEAFRLDGYDFIVMGPGPGDPREEDLPRMAHLRSCISTLLFEKRPFLAICLSHQVLSMRLGFPLFRREVPNQGVQREIDLFGLATKVGFYNTFAARSTEDKVVCADVGVVEVSRDIGTGEVNALRGAHFASLQFHPESILTLNGTEIIRSLLKEVLS